MAPGLLRQRSKSKASPIVASNTAKLPIAIPAVAVASSEGTVDASIWMWVSVVGENVGENVGEDTVDVGIGTGLSATEC